MTSHKPAERSPGGSGAAGRVRRHCRRPVRSAAAGPGPCVRRRAARPPGPPPCSTRRGCRSWPWMCCACCSVGPPPAGTRFAAARPASPPPRCRPRAPLAPRVPAMGAGAGTRRPAPPLADLTAAKRLISRLRKARAPLIRRRDPAVKGQSQRVRGRVSPPGLRALAFAFWGRAPDPRCYRAPTCRARSAPRALPRARASARSSGGAGARCPGLLPVDTSHGVEGGPLALPARVLRGRALGAARARRPGRTRSAQAAGRDPRRQVCDWRAGGSQSCRRLALCCPPGLPEDDPLSLTRETFPWRAGTPGPPRDPRTAPGPPDRPATPRTAPRGV